MSFFDGTYAGIPPWDIGRPQRAFAGLLEAGEIAEGPVLDVGCGTGEHVLMLAAAGLEAIGIDLSPRAIAKARQKAKERGLQASFLRGNALELTKLRRQVATVLDCGLFHTFEDEERAAFAGQLAEVLRPGGIYFMMCFSDLEPTEWGGPRRISRAEIIETFDPPRFRVRSIEDTRFESHLHTDGGRAFLAAIERS